VQFHRGRLRAAAAAAVTGAVLLVPVLQVDAAHASGRGGASASSHKSSSHRSHSPASMKRAFRAQWASRNYEPQDGGLADVVAHIENGGEKGEVIFFRGNSTTPWKLRAYEPWGQSHKVQFQNPDNGDLYKVGTSERGPVLTTLRTTYVEVPFSELTDVHFRPASRKP
jgi:hypothetical protein